MDSRSLDSGQPAAATTVPAPPPLPAVSTAPTDGAAVPEAGSVTNRQQPDDVQTLAAVCRACGGQIRYAPGTTLLRCTACGGEQPIGDTDAISEHSFDDWVAAHPRVKVASFGPRVTHCQGCGAQLETTDLTTVCQFCGGNVVLLDQPDGVIAPEAVVPFGIDKPAAQKAFKKWVSTRWFAPNALKKVGSMEALRGTYVPHWTFDAHTQTSYVGERGEYYYVTRTRTGADGKQETYQERKTRWYPASGHVRRNFDDVLVSASTRVAPDKLGQMGPWELSDAVGFEPEYLEGYSALRYDVDPQDGSVKARRAMERVIDRDIREDIGGDDQRVTNMAVSYSQVMFKLALLPLWVATYLYGGKTWQVLVNANTGHVVGDRPWSKVKIAFASAVAAILVITGWILFGGSNNNTVTVGDGVPCAVSCVAHPANDAAPYPASTMPETDALVAA